MVKIIFYAGGVVCLILVLFFVLQSPQTERVWVPELSRTSTTLIENDVVVISNVRDFTYDEYDEYWIPFVEIPVEEVKRVWFMLEPFGDWDHVGHTFLSFELQDGRAYSFSIEARKEVGERYSAFFGLFNKYELAYTWGTEKDFLSRRTLFLEHEVYMYPLMLEQEEVQELFTALVRETQLLAEKPQFYNTLTANCTNMLAKMVNRNLERTIPYDISWNLPGFSDRFLYRIGLIEGGEGVDALRAQHEVSQYTGALEGEFSKSLREQLGYY